MVYAVVFALTAGLSPAVYGAPVELSDSLLDSVTAGSAEVSSHNGGLIVGNTSTALVRNFDGVQLEGGAQKNAKSLNLVNSSNASVANGVNLWIGDDPSANMEKGSAAFSQMNTFEQDRRISTKSGEWIYEGENVTETSIESSSAIFDGGIIPAILTFEGLSTIDGEETSEPIKQELRIGIGGAWAGEVSGDISESQLSFSSTDTTKIKTTAEVAITVFGIKIILAKKEEEQVLKNEISVEKEFGGLSLPEGGTGVGCVVLVGDCFGGGTYEVASEKTRKTFTPGLPSPDSSAEIIVMGEGGLDLQNNYTVSLSNNSQQNTRAFNLVNSGGGILANGINLSRSTSFGIGGALRQNNSILQKR